MTDRELLVLAAKTAGIKIEWKTCVAHPKAIHGCCFAKVGTYDYWNPLTDDGDALRLAVRLRLSIDHNHSADQNRWVAADRNGCEGCYEPVSCVEDDFEEAQRNAATRRAIVRAAAEIGREMK